MSSFVAKVAIFESHSNNGRNGCSLELLHFYFSILKFFLGPTLLVPLPAATLAMANAVKAVSMENIMVEASIQEACLKSHAVTLYEAGKLGHASITDLCKDLSTLEGTKFEGEL
ncbi:hypothetical protein LOK49_LG05G02323 [Camellia lanceoleosa]|uniref:Uncharacterized protein n=1 Tax=Camellia lanceoleosa TaxID=1840588 RepID=A0ACC0HS70_9ERIC|nr:hypothetical protein LOK49_LG05G02323 [Camellia lanceoleosa]